MKAKPSKRASRSSNSSMDTKKGSKKTRTFLAKESIDSEGYEQKWHSEKEIMMFGHAFVHWIKEELENPYSRRLSFAKFWLINDIHYDTPRGWCKKYPEFKKLYKQAMALIGVKREDGMMMRELDRQATMWNQHHYGDVWKESDKYQADLKKETETAPGDFVIVKKSIRELAEDGISDPNRTK